ncbi:39S ribosomal protein L19, mitochondrial [Galemys pyrenaicus]|uniref:Large ribosomal subunit protein bL19m n=1 Tax=Galemys pyrenaicus TaxID=202257 RepID=A0A8J6DJ64_GALPY|nr:39S ribosomal protein L19, mitochondrial [Galemys pyrenaicus]
MRSTGKSIEGHFLGYQEIPVTSDIRDFHERNPPRHRNLDANGKKCFLLLLGVEICFELYNPPIQEIQVVKLEKCLDDSLLYLQDVLPEYKTFHVNMKPVVELVISCTFGTVNLNIKMKPKPWSKCWECPKFNIKGIGFDLSLSEEQMKESQKWSQSWFEFDRMREYDTSKTEAVLWDEIETFKMS